MEPFAGMIPGIGSGAANCGMAAGSRMQVVEPGRASMVPGGQAARAKPVTASATMKAPRTITLLFMGGSLLYANSPIRCKRLLHGNGHVRRQSRHRLQQQVGRREVGYGEL